MEDCHQCCEPNAFALNLSSLTGKKLFGIKSGDNIDINETSLYRFFLIWIMTSTFPVDYGVYFLENIKNIWRKEVG